MADRIKGITVEIGGDTTGLSRALSGVNKDLQMKINDEIDRLIDLKDQMRAAIAMVSDVDEQMVLRYRYIHNKTWEQIGDELHADRATVYRWHNQALRHVRLPENPIKF